WPAGAVMALDFGNDRYMREQAIVDRGTVMSFARASSKLARNCAGDLVSFSPDVPAITDMGLSIEPAAMNNMTWSSDFMDALWSPQNCSIMGDGIIAPDGQTSGDLLTADTADAVHRLSKGTPTDAGQFCASVFVKSRNGSRYFGLKAGVAGADQPVFDLLAGTVVQSTGTIE